MEQRFLSYYEKFSRQNSENKDEASRYVVSSMQRNNKKVQQKQLCRQEKREDTSGQDAVFEARSYYRY